MSAIPTPAFPGEGLSTAKMPGHWLLARAGKRVLRPGGKELTQRLLKTLHIGTADDVVEFAPGLGDTAEQVLRLAPHSYRLVERDPLAADRLQRRLAGENVEVLNASAESSGLPDGCASVVIAEAMLTMQPVRVKEQILREAFRLLRPGGQLCLHEMAIVGTEAEHLRAEIEGALALEIHHGVRPETLLGWRTLLESCGFQIAVRMQAPMALLEPQRLIADEGILRAAAFLGNVFTDSETRRRVTAMRAVFHRYRDYLSALGLIATKPVAKEF